MLRGVFASRGAGLLGAYLLRFILGCIRYCLGLSAMRQMCFHASLLHTVLIIAPVRYLLVGVLP
jgi:hypothetical protein